MDNVHIKCKGEKFGHNFLQGKCLSCNDSQQGLTVSYRGKEYEEEKKKLSKIKIESSHQAYAVEIRDNFPKEQEKLLWITFANYQEQDIRQAFRVCRDKGIYDVKYLRGVLRNL